MPSNGWKNWHWICLFKLSPMMCFYLSPEGRRNKQSYTIEFQRKENGLNLSKGYLLQWGTCMNSKPRHLQVSSFQILVTSTPRRPSQQVAQVVSIAARRGVIVHNHAIGLQWWRHRARAHPSLLRIDRHVHPPAPFSHASTRLTTREENDSILPFLTILRGWLRCTNLRESKVVNLPTDKKNSPSPKRPTKAPGWQPGSIVWNPPLFCYTVLNTLTCYLFSNLIWWFSIE